jgi:TorA maturation chaperone TorD
MVYSNEQWMDFSAMFTWLADVFYQTPSDLKLIAISENIKDWPLLTTDSEATISTIISSISLDGLILIKEDFNRLFVGPGKKEVYPWGSIYTDKEGLLFGPSTILWEQFCKQYNINITPSSNEPSDHFALIFYAIVAVMQSEYDNEFKGIIVDKILSTHFYPWGIELLSLIDMKAETDYFRGFSLLATDLISIYSTGRG